MSISGIVNSYHAQFLNPWLNDSNALVIQNQSAHATLFMIFSFVLIFTLSKDGLDKLLELISWITFFNCLYLFYVHFYGPGTYGLMMNTSTEGTFLAIMTPIIILKKDQMKFLHRFKVLYAVPVVATFYTTSSMGIGGLALSAFVYSLLRKDKTIVVAGLLISCAILIGAYYFLGERFVSDSGRILCWKWSFDWWFKGANLLLGTGLGSFWVIGPHIQQTTTEWICGHWGPSATCEAAKIQYQYNNLYLFMHSDWLQVLFETGIVGFLIAVIAYVISLIKSIDKDWLFIAVVSVGAQCAGNMVVRYTLPALATLIIFRYSLEKNKSNDLLNEIKKIYFKLKTLQKFELK